MDNHSFEVLPLRADGQGRQISEIQLLQVLRGIEFQEEKQRRPNLFLSDNVLIRFTGKFLFPLVPGGHGHLSFCRNILIISINCNSSIQWSTTIFLFILFEEKGNTKFIWASHKLCPFAAIYALPCN